jgi:hypothetical protein
MSPALRVLAIWLLATVLLVLIVSVPLVRAWCARRHLHDWTLRLTPTRIYLLCTSCHAETPGWDLHVPLPDGRRRTV